MLFLSLVKISRFTNDAGESFEVRLNVWEVDVFMDFIAGLEKTLRFLQSFAQVVAAYSASAAHAKPWLLARTQFALGSCSTIFVFSVQFNLTGSRSQIHSFLQIRGRFQARLRKHDSVDWRRGDSQDWQMGLPWDVFVA